MALAKPLAVVGLALLVGAGLTACDNSTSSGCTKPAQTAKPAFYTPAKGGGGGGGHGSGGHSSGEGHASEGGESGGSSGSRPAPFFLPFGGGHRSC